MGLCPQTHIEKEEKAKANKKEDEAEEEEISTFLFKQTKKKRKSRVYQRRSITFLLVIKQSLSQEMSLLVRY